MAATTFLEAELGQRAHGAEASRKVTARSQRPATQRRTTAITRDKSSAVMADPDGRQRPSAKSAAANGEVRLLRKAGLLARPHPCATLRTIP
ncbi:MAG: hypothetical protein KDD83_24575, partial [Caldilineaceae bacterium]|nr:hypothetical protein [Caldilineaceae bacterium]